ncbi:hypothetical protein [Paratractidigestivibacter faecalis]|uniref:hypothetical protein n=1 Tax=Paratractidigestivibacter faecalis TaxID=2292441 RepID=UPI003A930C7A
MTADRVGGVVTLAIAGSYSISDAWGSVKICDLPWKPTQSVFFAVVLQGGLSGVVGVIRSNGDVCIQGKNTQWQSGWLFGAASYVCS